MYSKWCAYSLTREWDLNRADPSVCTCACLLFELQIMALKFIIS